MEYYVLSDNMERLEKKLNRIKTKCEKHGCSFRYEKKEEVYKTIQLSNGSEIVAKYILVDVEGKAIVNDWKFIASVEYTENGNIFRKVTDDEIPERYYNCQPYCEHCNQKRERKNSYIVYNTKTEEFKQVGKSCLAEFTHGLSAEMVTSYIAMFDTLIEGEEVLARCHITPQYKMFDMLCFMAETIRLFGFVKSDEPDSTKERAYNYYCASNHSFSSLMKKREKQLIEEMEQKGFDAESESIRHLAQQALTWLSEQDETSDYIHSLKIICGMEYIEAKHFGFLASLIPTYKKAMDKKKKQEAKVNLSKSEYVGEIKERITIKIASVDVIASWATDYGYTSIYRILDTDGNEYTWKTSKSISEDVKTLVATVKAHTEYNGIKQTEITRARVKVN